MIALKSAILRTFWEGPKIGLPDGLQPGPGKPHESAYFYGLYSIVLISLMMIALRSINIMLMHTCNMYKIIKNDVFSAPPQARAPAGDPLYFARPRTHADFSDFLML